MKYVIISLFIIFSITSFTRFEASEKSKYQSVRIFCEIDKSGNLSPKYKIYKYHKSRCTQYGGTAKVLVLDKSDVVIDKFIIRNPREHLSPTYFDNFEKYPFFITLPFDYASSVITLQGIHPQGKEVKIDLNSLTAKNSVAMDNPVLLNILSSDKEF